MTTVDTDVPFALAVTVTGVPLCSGPLVGTAEKVAADCPAGTVTDVGVLSIVGWLLPITSSVFCVAT